MDYSSCIHTYMGHIARRVLLEVFIVTFPCFSCVGGYSHVNVDGPRT